MILKIAKLYIPEFIKNKKLDDLFRITAAAFECETPVLKGLPFAERLREYAVFTKGQAERYLNWEGSPEERKRRIDAVEEKLYQYSFLLGQDLRKSLHIMTQEQTFEALGIIYKMIGIDFHIGGPAGSESCGPDEFTVKECFFSRYYSAEVCGLISSLDRGLAAGLIGRSRLDFTQRITEGCGCCSGFLTFN